MYDNPMETDYEGQADAMALARAEEIKLDPGRAIRAKKQARIMAKERENELKAMNLVAGRMNGLKAGRRTTKGGILGGMPASPYSYSTYHN